MLAVAWAVAFPGVVGCRESAPSVTVLCSVDESFIDAVLKPFERKTGIVVRAVTDSEASKTTGLLSRIRAEGEHPRADVLFSSEIFGTIELANQGFLESYDSPAAADLPPAFRDPKHRWAAIGLRGRVIAYDPTRVDAESLPRDWESFGQPQWASRLAIANPLFGTTRGHVAAMFAIWGPDRARSFLRSLRDHGALILGSNSATVRAVRSGRADLCVTDTDDVFVARRDGASLAMIYPDMGAGGTLWIPCSVAILKNCPHPDQARQLVDYLLSPPVEITLARSPSQNVPVRPNVARVAYIQAPRIPRFDYEKIAASLPVSESAVRDILLR